MITAHTLIKNESRFIWYSIVSVLDFVDEIMVWDTGSTDQTLAIVKAIDSPKVKIYEFGSVSVHSFSTARQEMLDRTSSDWIMILDGDEVWPSASLSLVINQINAHPNTESIVVRSNNLVGDIYHRLPRSAGQYHLAGQSGHLNLRFIHKGIIPGLHVSGVHGQQGYYDDRGRLIQNRDPQKVVFIDVPYHHATHLIRSNNDFLVPKRSFKLKYELGESIPSSEIPKVFFKEHPSLVPNVTSRASLLFVITSLIFTPFRRLRRLIYSPPSGY
jgi:glycosyltransferase involved in cell wall biosynthesis